MLEDLDEDIIQAGPNMMEAIEQLTQSILEVTGGDTTTRPDDEVFLPVSPLPAPTATIPVVPSVTVPPTALLDHAETDDDTDKITVHRDKHNITLKTKPGITNWVITDSNGKHFRNLIPGTQLDIVSGINMDILFLNLAKLKPKRNLPTQIVKNLILSVGINDRGKANGLNKASFNALFSLALELAERVFFVGITHDPSGIAPVESERIKFLNEYAKTYTNLTYIPPLTGPDLIDPNDFYGIHLTTHAARTVLDNINATLLSLN